MIIHSYVNVSEFDWFESHYYYHSYQNPSTSSDPQTRPPYTNSLNPFIWPEFIICILETDTKK